MTQLHPNIQKSGTGGICFTDPDSRLVYGNCSIIKKHIRDDLFLKADTGSLNKADGVSPTIVHKCRPRLRFGILSSQLATYFTPRKSLIQVQFFVSPLCISI